MKVPHLIRDDRTNKNLYQMSDVYLGCFNENLIVEIKSILNLAGYSL